MTELINKANIELKKINDFLMKYKDVFTNSYNLKVYDVSYYCYSDNNIKTDFPVCYENYNINDLFNIFCEDQYMYFEDWAEENSIKLNKNMKYIRNTSSYYYVDDNSIIDKEYYDLNTTVENLINQCYGYIHYYNVDDLIKNNKIDIDFLNEAIAEDGFTIEEIKDDIEYIITEAYNELMYNTEDAIKIYNYVKDFKDNQITLFKDFLACREEML